MSFMEKVQFWKKAKDPFNFDNAFGGQDDSFNSADGNEPLPPLDDPSAMGQDPLAFNDPLASDDPLTPGVVSDKYGVPQDPLASPDPLAGSQSRTSSINPSATFFSGHKSEKELTDSLARKYVVENEANEQRAMDSSQQAPSASNQSQGSFSSRDLEIINLKLDAVKSDVSSLGHQLEKIERMLKDNKKSW